MQRICVCLRSLGVLGMYEIFGCTGYVRSIRCKGCRRMLGLMVLGDLGVCVLYPDSESIQNV